MASSAQWTSSTTIAVGRRAPSVSSSASSTGSRAPPSSAPASGPPAARATSWSGPSGRGATERVARAPERAHLARAEHGADQRGLADPGLAQHEHDPAVGAGPVQCAPEGGLLLLALKQLHDPVHRPYPGARRA